MDHESSLLDLVALKHDIEDLLARPVDVVTEAALSPYIRDKILMEALPLGVVTRRIFSTCFKRLPPAHRIPVRLVSVDFEASITLATTHGLYAYDAYYLHCSLSQGQPLLTLDHVMRRVAKKLGIQLLV